MWSILKELWDGLRRESGPGQSGDMNALAFLLAIVVIPPAIAIYALYHLAVWIISLFSAVG